VVPIVYGSGFWNNAERTRGEFVDVEFFKNCNFLEHNR